MLFLNNAFSKDIRGYNGEVLKGIKNVDGKIYLSNLKENKNEQNYKIRY